MSRIEYPVVNGHRTSYCSITFDVNGFPITGVKSINYRETLEIGKVKGTSPKPIGRTRGNLAFEGDIEIYQSEWKNKLLPQLKGLFGLAGFSEGSVPVSVAYSEGFRPDICVDRLIGVRFHSPDQAATEGTDANVVKLTLDIMDILWANNSQSLRG